MTQARTKFAGPGRWGDAKLGGCNITGRGGINAGGPQLLTTGLRNEQRPPVVCIADPSGRDPHPSHTRAPFGRSPTWKGPRRSPAPGPFLLPRPRPIDMFCARRHSALSRRCNKRRRITGREYYGRVCAFLRHQPKRGVPRVGTIAIDATLQATTERSEPSLLAALSRRQANASMPRLRPGGLIRKISCRTTRNM